MLLAERCRRIDMLVLDVDGVLTDGGITYTDQGAELKTFHVRDGSGIKLWLACGKKACLLTGRSSAIVTRRATELGVTAVVQGTHDKLAAFRGLMSEQKVAAERTAYVGDDLPDLPVLTAAGLAVAVADACPEARALAHHVTRLPGGRGAARETIEWLLRAQGRWQEALGARGN